MTEKLYTEPELAALAELLSGSVESQFGRSFVGPAIAMAWAKRILEAGYVPPTRFFIVSDEALAAAEQRGVNKGVRELEEAVHTAIHRLTGVAL